MDEFEFIKQIKPNYYRHDTIIKGIGDDAAVFRQPYQDVVTAVDTFVEGIHFSKKTMDPFHIGYRVLAANISDMAAMGATPVSYLISLVVPKEWTDEELIAIYKGMESISKAYKIDLIGGDTVSGDQLVLSVTINGKVEKDKVRLRHHVRSGDVLFVTGTLGDSACGLDLLLSDDPRVESHRYLIDRHRLPTPRVDFAERLKVLNRVALNDISDGISSEANELAESSGVSIYLDYDQLPISDELRSIQSNKQEEFILAGGEDFELLGAVSEKDWPIVQEAAEKSNLTVTQVGYATDGDSTVYIHQDEKVRLLKRGGYVHRN
ncbi:thiamine-phosphate kinase [Pelagirhabdus alkalitolerans]|uniref:Thiamine-monophosphate kinase n=1 Tax=Pelagirhabdus alkalitolerans TaxID=1612202 RepID=A0A1G6J4F0_9BACI|nr:thiamine-phosphate kinase [Pelagirhabdus alkalitolerans]SDC13145.1 thiamine-phosphate kinase [Pelagirhabdus alkalitolerans]